MIDKNNLLKKLLIKQKGKCYWCGEELLSPELDHIIPKSWGGLLIENNAVLSCRSCNQKKLNRLWIKSKSGKTAKVYYLDETKTDTIIDIKNSNIIIKTTIKIKKW